LILLVHNINRGEYDKDEIEFINKLKTIFPTPDDFIKRIIFVGTFLDSKDGSAELQNILEKMQKQLESYCGLKNVNFNFVSSRRYFKGIKESKNLLIKNSGISELKNIINNNAKILYQNKSIIQNERFEDIKRKIINKLKAIKNEKNNKIELLKEEFDNSYSEIILEWDRLKDNIKIKWDYCVKMINEYDLL